jgi:hypothetical protein
MSNNITGFQLGDTVYKIDFENLDNLPFYEMEAETEVTVISSLDSEGTPIPLNYSIGLIAGQKYLVDGVEFEAISTSAAGLAEGGALISDDPSLNEPSFAIVDKINMDLSNPNPFYFDENSCIVLGAQDTEYTVKGIFYQFKKLDKKFLPDDIAGATAIQVATPTTLGGVMPVEKTAEMNTPVGITSEGKLYTNVPLITTTETIAPNSTNLPTSEAVYTFITQLLEEAEY